MKAIKGKIFHIKESLFMQSAEKPAGESSTNRQKVAKIINHTKAKAHNQLIVKVSCKRQREQTNLAKANRASSFGLLKDDMKFT